MRRTREELETQSLEELFERFRQSPDGYAFVPLADACRKMGRIDEALEICGTGVKRHPAYPSGHVVRGKCLYDSGNPSAAREAFERVLLLDENNLVALKYVGMIEADDGNLSAAEIHLKRILSFDPENKEIKSILRLVEEQGQIEQAAEEPIETMEAVDEILADAVPTPGTKEDDEDEPARALSMEADLASESRGAPSRDAPSRGAPSRDAPSRGAPSRGAPSSDDVETSDELASVTLADIFAAQGYTSKAAKIYREVLRKQPANDAIRTRLGELTGETVEVSDPHDEPGTGESAELPEIAEQAPPSDVTPETPSAQERQGESAPLPQTPSGAGPEADEEAGDAAALEEAGSPAPAPVPVGPRPEIPEKESLSHFRHWVTRLRG